MRGRRMATARGLSRRSVGTAGVMTPPAGRHLRRRRLSAGTRDALLRSTRGPYRKRLVRRPPIVPTLNAPPRLIAEALINDVRGRGPTTIRAVAKLGSHPAHGLHATSVRRRW